MRCRQSALITPLAIASPCPAPLSAHFLLIPAVGLSAKIYPGYSLAGGNFSFREKRDRSKSCFALSVRKMTADPADISAAGRVKRRYRLDIICRKRRGRPGKGDLLYAGLPAEKNIGKTGFPFCMVLPRTAGEKSRQENTGNGGKIEKPHIKTAAGLWPDAVFFCGRGHPPAVIRLFFSLSGCFSF